MRVIAPILGSRKYKRAMLHATCDGVYLFLYSVTHDGPADADHWFETLDDAKIAALAAFGVASDQWTEIDDPLPECQQDWITPARIPGRSDGDPQWGRLELFINGQWQEMDVAGAIQLQIPAGHSRQPRL